MFAVLFTEMTVITFPKFVTVTMINVFQNDFNSNKQTNKNLSPDWQLNN